jgi:hypothetical protein
MQAASKSNSMSNATNFHTSATVGNGIGVSQLTRTGKETGKQLKPNTIAAPHLLDEDDSAKRALILQGPEKGSKQLSSAVSHLYLFETFDDHRSRPLSRLKNRSLPRMKYEGAVQKEPS